MNASRTVLLASLLGACGLAAHAEPARAPARTDLVIPHSERDAVSVSPRGGLSGFVTMRDELENYPATPMGNPGFSAPPASFTGPVGFDWGLNTLRGINTSGYTTLVDLSGSPMGDNDTTVVRIFTVESQPVGQFIAGVTLRWDTPVGAVNGNDASGSAEHYLSTLAQLYTFESANVADGFITSRLLWGGVNTDDESGLPVGPVNHFYNLEPTDSVSQGMFQIARYCISGGAPIPGCTPPAGFDVGDPVAPPIGQWFKITFDLTDDARLTHSLDLYDGAPATVISDAAALTGLFFNRVGWNSSFETAGATLFVDNIEVSGAIGSPATPPDLGCAYLDDIEWLSAGPLFGQTARWFSALSSAVSVVNTGGASGQALQQTNTQANNLFQTSARSTLASTRANRNTPSWTLCVDASTANGETVRALTLEGADGLTARLFLGAIDPVSTSFIPSLFVQTNPDYNPAGGPPVIGSDIVAVAPWDDDDTFRAICARVQRNGALVLSVDGSTVYTGQAFSTSINAFRFETANNASGAGSRLRVDNLSLACAPACPGDTNGDGVINFTDLNTVLADFGQFNPFDEPLFGDINGDGVVNFVDLNLLIGNFGNDCP